jgi:hypothetical protein
MASGSGDWESLGVLIADILIAKPASLRHAQWDAGGHVRPHLTDGVLSCIEDAMTGLPLFFFLTDRPAKPSHCKLFQITGAFNS